MFKIVVFSLQLVLSSFFLLFSIVYYFLNSFESAINMVSSSYSVFLSLCHSAIKPRRSSRFLRIVQLQIWNNFLCKSSFSNISCSSSSYVMSKFQVIYIKHGYFSSRICIERSDNKNYISCSIVLKKNPQLFLPFLFLLKTCKLINHQLI